MNFQTAAFHAADKAWSDELRRLFGKTAGDVRYTAKANGEPGTDLARLYTEREAARAAWEATFYDHG